MDIPERVYAYDEHKLTPHNPRTSAVLKQWYSPSNNYVQINPHIAVAQPGSEHAFEVRHSVTDEGNVKLFYQVRKKTFLEVFVVAMYGDVGLNTSGDVTW